MVDAAPSTGIRRWLLAAMPAFLFGLAHSQAPLYYSNQHQYMLHGLAQAGVGHLRHDWLANTTDPTPLFSAWVALTYRIHECLFHVYFFVALAGYVHALLAIFHHLTGRRWTDPPGLVFLMFLTLTHAGVIRWVSAQGLGKDYPWYLQAGVAGQYLLGPGLQPSVSGVFLLAALALFLARRPRWAIVASSLAAVIHATYLPTAAFLTLAFMAVTARRESLLQAMGLGIAALLMVLPVVIDHVGRFGPTDSATFAEAQRIMAHDRIPHHAQPARWFDLIAGLQLAWIVAALLLVRRSPLFALMAIPLVLAAALSLVQVATGNDTLALLFPWRTSVILVPLATAIILTRISTWIGRLPGVRLVSVATLLLLAVAGLIISQGDVAYRMNTDELPLLDHIREHKTPGDLYLLPVEIPKHRAAGRGVVSTSFTRPPRRGKQVGLISVDLQRFRLYTGAPIFVDFKSIPYRDTDVLEWWERMKLSQWLYEQPDWDADDVRRALEANRITHVVAPANRPIPHSAAVETFADEHYRLYRLQPPAQR